MSDVAIEADVIKRTQDTLGKYVKRPALTEKVLKKPPFRFLFDVVAVVIRDTGYFEGLYTPDELNIENINDREKKMKFLQKLIDVIKIATNEPLTVKSSKIVAGHDPEKTNELLQQMAVIIEKKIDLKSAVEAVNNGEVPVKIKSKSKEKLKEGKEKKTSSKDPDIKKTPKEKTSEKTSPKGLDEKKTPKEKAKSEIKEKTKTNEGSSKKSSRVYEPEKKEKKAKSKTSITDVKDALKKSSPEKATQPETDTLSKPETAVKSKQSKHSPSKDKERPDVDPAVVELKFDNKLETPAENGSPTTEVKRDKRRASKKAEEILLTAITEDSSVSENRRSSGSKRSSAQSRKSSAEKIRLSSVDETQVKTSLESIEALKTVVEESSPAVASIDSKAQSRPDSDQNPEVKRETTFVRENSKDSVNNHPRPRTSLRPPSARPASARPGAPRRRDKNIEIILQPNDQVKLSGINVRLENFNSELEDDGENLVIIENPNTGDPLLESRLDTVKSDGDESLQQGHLVQQILETQKELVQGSSSDIDQKLEKEYDMNKSANRQSSARQMNSLRDLIQTLTKSVNPLGKLMDFMPEDIDSMQLELTMWRDTYNQASVELKKERSLTESVTEPMKNQLINIESTIKEYQEMIDACRVKILQNADKIQRLLTTQ